MSARRSPTLLWLALWAVFLTSLAVGQAPSSALVFPDDPFLPPTTSTHSTHRISTDLPIVPTAMPRPQKKPWLLTDKEYATLWDPNPNELRLGVLFPFDIRVEGREEIVIRKALSVIRMAVRDINERKIIPGMNMSVLLRDSQDANLYTSSGGAAAISGAGRLIGAKVAGVIGDVRSDLTRYEALMTSSVQIPQCSFASASTILSDIKNYPYFYRTIPTTINVLDAMLVVIERNGWKRISIIYDMDVLGWTALDHFRNTALKMGIFVLVAQPISTPDRKYDPTFDFIKQELRKAESRVQILIAFGATQFEFLRQMRISGLMDSYHAWITMNDIADQIQLREPNNTKDYDGLIMVDNGWNLTGYEAYDEFVDSWTKLDTTEYPGSGTTILDNNEGMAYSCVMMMALAYRNLVNVMIPNPDQRTPDNVVIRNIVAGHHTEDIIVQNLFTQHPYLGPAGPVTLDASGDRLDGFYIAMTMNSGDSEVFATIFAGNYTEVKNPFFKEGLAFPADAPPWSIRNPRWNEPKGIIMGILCAVGLLLTLASAIFVIYFRHHIIVKAASPLFCLCELLGILLIFMWTITLVDPPKGGVCITRPFLMTTGVALLSGSLTVKNYRIYKIFNSVTVSNQAFRTYLLLRIVFVVVLLSLIPSIVEMVIKTPQPAKINIRAIQWVQCQGYKSRLSLVALSYLIPFLMMLFGVFLAFKTRNVVDLWNEAQQISWVLYNITFFMVVLLLSQLFPDDIYPATFYISFICAIIMAYVSLFVLFLPKIWGVYNSYSRSWTGGAEDDHGQTNGGLFGTTDAFSRLPKDLKSTQSRDTFVQDRSHSICTTQTLVDPSSSPTPLPLDAHSVRALNRRTASSPTDSRKHTRHLTIPGSSSNGRRNVNPIDQWMSEKMSKTAMANMTDGMNEDSKSMQGTFMSATDIQEIQARRPAEIEHPSEGSGNQRSPRSRRLSRVVTAAEMRDLPVLREEEARLEEQQAQRRTFGSMDSISPKALDSFVFLLPIRVQGNPLSWLLSQWSMTTLILTPACHAFLAVRSTDSKPTSYLMISMVQLQDIPEPTLRITTSQSGTLLVRFMTQERLDIWMNLFSEEDIITLASSGGRTTGGRGVSGAHGGPPQFGNRSSSSASHTTALDLRLWQRTEPDDPGYHAMDDNGHENQSRARQQNYRRSSRALMDSAFGETPPPRPLGSSLSSDRQQPEMRELGIDNNSSGHIPSHGHGGEDVNQRSDQPKLWEDLQQQYPAHQGQTFMTAPQVIGGPPIHYEIPLSTPPESTASFVPTSPFPPAITATLEDLQDNYIPVSQRNHPDDIVDNGDTTVAPLSTRELGILEALGSGGSPYTMDNPTADQPVVPSAIPHPLQRDPDTIQPLPQPRTPPPALQRALSSMHQHPHATMATSTSTIEPQVPTFNTMNNIGDHDDDDDDGEDLYDPEFGIGNGHCQRRSHPHYQPLSHLLPRNPSIPSAAVITAAAAAVAGGGWSESAALAAAKAHQPSAPPPRSFTLSSSSSGFLSKTALSASTAAAAGLEPKFRGGGGGDDGQRDKRANSSSSLIAGLFSGPAPRQTTLSPSSTQPEQQQRSRGNSLPGFRFGRRPTN